MLTNKPKRSKSSQYPSQYSPTPKPANLLISFDIIKTGKALAAKRGWGRKKGDQGRGQKRALGNGKEFTWRKWKEGAEKQVRKKQEGRHKRRSTFYTPNYKRWLCTPPPLPFISSSPSLLLIFWFALLPQLISYHLSACFAAMRNPRLHAVQETLLCSLNKSDRYV